MCTCPGLRACSAHVHLCRVGPNKALDSGHKLPMNIVLIPEAHVQMAPGAGVCVAGVTSVGYMH